MIYGFRTSLGDQRSNEDSEEHVRSLIGYALLPAAVLLIVTFIATARVD